MTSSVLPYQQLKTPSACREPSRWARLALFVLPLIGAILVFVGSPHGLGLTNDSARYLRIAKVVSGEQRLGKIYPEYMRHFPPGYPAMLAAGKCIGLDELEMGRWWNALAMALTTLIIGFTVYRLCDRTLWPALVASALVVVSHVSLEMHLHIWSEPAFQVFLLITISLLARQVDAPSRRRAILIGLIVAASTMLRYAGASMIIMGTLTLFFLQRSSWRDRFIDCVIFAGIAVAPLLYLASYNHQRTESGEALDRTIKFYGVHRVQLREAWTTFATWIFPEHKNPVSRRNWEFLAVVIAFAAVVASRMWIRSQARRHGDYQRPPLPTYVRLALMMCGVYLAFLFVSLAFVDPATPLDARILSPIYLLAIVIGTYGVHRALTLGGPMRAPFFGKIATVAMLIAFCICTAVRGYDTFAYSRREGFGYMNARWRNSQLMQAIRAIAPNTLVYTNVPDAVYFFTTNQSRLIPKSDRKLTPKAMKAMRSQLKETQRRIRSEGAVIALFYGTADTRFRRGSQSSAEIEQILAARRVINCKDGVMMIPQRASAKVKQMIARARRAVFGAPTTQASTQSATQPTTAPTPVPTAQPATKKSTKEPRAR